MRYVTIEPESHLISFIECDTFEEALQRAGLTIGQVDHGLIDNDAGVGIVVAEFGLFVEPERQHYFTFGGRLYGGNALLYGYGEEGQTVDVPNIHLAPIFLHGREEVEEAIKSEFVVRPVKCTEGFIMWQWPEPSPYSHKGAAA